jgi:REP element-mobilizing transposase RayT
MTAARQVIPGRTYFISRRCTQRQMFLRPDSTVNQIIEYCLAEAVERFEVTLHAYEVMSNHLHMIIRDNLGNFPEFLAHFHKMVAKAMNALLGRWENFWATEQPNAVYLPESSDRFAKLIYLLANPVAADLVDRVSDWPGASSYSMHLSGRARTVKRPRVYFRAKKSKMPEEVTLRIERLEGYEDLSEAEWQTEIQNAVRIEEERARAERQAAGRTVLGRKAVMRVKPTDVPKSVAPRRGLRPHLACMNEERRVAELLALDEFRAKRREALERLQAGELDVVFPYGTYRIRGVFRSAAPPVADAA